MDNEELFLMIDECIQHAQKALTKEQKLNSFAMVLEENNTSRKIEVKQMDEDLRYEELLAILRDEVKSNKIIAIALLANVSIPENFNSQFPHGIRLHIEEKAFEAENKLSARLLYVPYQLFKAKDSDELHIQLHNPIPVGLACEIFV